MVVLALDKRLLVFVVLAVRLAVPRRVVHGAEDVGVAPVTTSLLPLAGTRLILGLHPIVGSLEVGAVDGLVAQRPHDDGRMVEVCTDIVLVALQYLLGEEGLLGFCILAVAESVALLISFCRHVDTVLVAQVIPNGVVRIVTGTDGVDVQALHNLDILNHALPTYHIAPVGVQFVAVSTLDENGFSVH